MRQSGAIVIAALVLTGCTAPSPHSTPTGAGSLVIWTDEVRKPAVEHAAAAFTQASGLPVTITTQSLASNRELMLARIPLGKGPDLAFGRAEWAGTLAVKGVVAPVNLGAHAADFTPTALKTATYNGSTYCLPTDLTTVFLVRNKSLAAEVPSKFDELIKAGRALKDQGKVDVPVAIGDGRSGVADAYHLYPLQTSFGAPVLATGSSGGYDNRTVGMNNDGGIQFANYLTTLGKDKAIDPTLTSDAAVAAFTAGRLAYLVTDDSSLPAIRKSGVGYAISAVPAAGGSPAASFVSSTCVYLSAKAKRTSDAQQFLSTYLAAAETQAELAKAVDRAGATTKPGVPAPSDDAAAVQKVADGGVPMPNAPAIDDIWNPWASTESALITGKEADPATAWRKMCESISEQLRK